MIGQRTALEWGEAIHRREIGVRELTLAALDSLEAAQPRLHAMITICREAALEQADLVQRRVDDGVVASPLAGVPMAYKDNIATRGIRTTCASRMLEDYVPMFDAAVVERLTAADAVCVGKLNMDEFAMGSTSETSAFGTARNPWNLARCPGGSSGGAAAAVGARLLPYALGSDTGGSIRQPCGFCGITGLKPSYGAVSRWGLIAYASSLDQIGPMARDVRDCAAVFDCIAGKDPRDGTSVECAFPPLAQSAQVRGLRIGLPREAFSGALDPMVRAAVLDAAGVLETLGAHVEWMDLPMLDYAVPAYYIIASAEAASNLSRYDGLRYGRAHRESGQTLEEALEKARGEGFGREVKRRLMLGNFALSAGYYDAFYAKALKAKALLCEAFAEAFGRFDLLLTPTAPSTAMGMGESLEDPLAMYLGDVHTVAVNLAGLPALALPCGRWEGLPIGMQLIGAQFTESCLLSAGLAFQQATAHHLAAPEGGATL